MPYINFPIIGNERQLPYYVFGVGVDFCQNDVYRSEGYPHPQFVFFTQGEGEMVIGERTIPLPKNSSFFIPAHVPHRYYNTGGEWHSWWIYFNGTGVPALLEPLGFTSPIFNQPAENEHLFRILRKIYNVITGDKLFGNHYASAYLYEFILEYYRFSKLPSPNSDVPNGMLRAIEHIDAHYVEKITMERLCRCADLSEAHLCRLFKKHLGMRPMEYLNKKRIQKAKELLTSSYISVESAAAKVGFGSPSYFGKLFRTYEGCTPSEYRRSYAGQ